MNRTNHRAAAERMLADADEWGRQAEEPTPEVGELTCLAYAAVHALLAIHDALTAADRYAANEAKQREAGADPLDEDDHRDRLDRHGDIWQRAHEGCWMVPGFPPVSHGPAQCLQLAALPGPLTFAPEPPQDATGDDLTASEGESGAEDGGEADEAVEPLLCPECGEGITDHPVWDDARFQLRCRLTTVEAVRALIEQAVEQPRSSK